MRINLSELQYSELWTKIIQNDEDRCRNRIRSGSFDTLMTGFRFVLLEQHKAYRSVNVVYKFYKLYNRIKSSARPLFSGSSATSLSSNFNEVLLGIAPITIVRLRHQVDRNRLITTRCSFANAHKFRIKRLKKSIMQ